jgi:WD40 repeat protein
MRPAVSEGIAAMRTQFLLAAVAFPLLLSRPGAAEPPADTRPGNGSEAVFRPLGGDKKVAFHVPEAAADRLTEIVSRPAGTFSKDFNESLRAANGGSPLPGGEFVLSGQKYRFYPNPGLLERQLPDDTLEVWFDATLERLGETLPWASHWDQAAFNKWIAGAEKPRRITKAPKVVFRPITSDGTQPEFRVPERAAARLAETVSRLGVVSFSGGGGISGGPYPDGTFLIGDKPYDFDALGHLSHPLGSGVIALWADEALDPLGKTIPQPDQWSAESFAEWIAELDRPTPESGPLRADRLGDPLPDGAVARLGSGRWWNAGEVHSLAFSPDGRTLIAGGTLPEFPGRVGDAIRGWDVVTGKLLYHVGWRAGGVTALALSPDGKILASTPDWLENRPIDLWKVLPGKAPRWFRTATNLKEKVRYDPQKKPQDLAFSPDRKLLAVAGNRPEDRDVRVFDVARSKELRRLTGHQGQVLCLAWSPNGKILASGGQDHWIKLWDPATGRDLFPVPGHHTSIDTLCWSPDGKVLASHSVSGTVRLWNPRTGTHLRALPHKQGDSMAFSADGRRLIAGGYEEALRVTDAATGRTLSVRESAEGEEWSEVVSADGQLIATQEENGAVRLWRLDAAKVLCRVRPGGTNGMLAAMALSPDGRTLVTSYGGRRSNVRLWDVNTGKLLRSLALPPGLDITFYSLSFAPDGRTLVCGQDDDLIHFWDVASGKENRPALRHCAYNSIAFSPDGRDLAVGGSDRTVRVWELATGREVRRFTGHEEVVTAVAFSPDGRLLASGGADGRVLVWDRTGRLGREGTLSGKELETLCESMGDRDASVADRAAWALAVVPAQSVPFLGDRLRPVTAERLAQLARWQKDLDSDDFATRERASRELARAGEEVESVLRRGLVGRPSAETRKRSEALLDRLRAQSPTPRRLREMRAFRVLEQAGTPEARDLLKRLAEGVPPAWLTRQAKASLERLAKRNPPGR